jgi:hypothetical protein
MKGFLGKEIQDIEVEFDEYIRNGGFPKSLEFDDLNARQVYTRGIISEIFEKDVKTSVKSIGHFRRVM